MATSFAPKPAAVLAPPLSRRLLVSLYLVAGMPLGTFADLLPLYMRTQGVGFGDIGLFSVLHLFYSLKVVWGPLVDRSGRTGRWLLATCTALAFAYLGLSQAAPKQRPGAFACATLLLVFASSVYDVAVDATFVRALANQSPAEEANANAWRLSSFKFAMVVLGNGCAVVAGLLGFAKVFVLLLGCHLVLLACVPWRALPATPAKQQAWASYFAGLVAWLRGPKVLHAFALVFCYKLAIASLLSLERTWWFDRGITLQQLGAVGGGVGLLSTVAGASLGSLLAHRQGVVPMLRWGIVAQALTALLYAGLHFVPVTLWALALGLAVSGGCFGLATAALMSLITRLCQAPHAATQFAALTGTYALTRSLGGSASGVVAEHFGFLPLFLAIAACCLPALWLLPRSQATKRAWRLLPGPADASVAQIDGDLLV